MINDTIQQYQQSIRSLPPPSRITIKQQFNNNNVPSSEMIVTLLSDHKSQKMLLSLESQPEDLLISPFQGPLPPSPHNSLTTSSFDLSASNHTQDWVVLNRAGPKYYILRVGHSIVCASRILIILILIFFKARLKSKNTRVI